MAMSKCRECGKAVSTLAKTCPSCGVPKPAKILKKKTTASKKSISRDIVPNIKNYKKNNDKIWVHCRNYQCRDYTQMYQIFEDYLNLDKCNFCSSKFMEVKLRNGKPIMPTDGIYDKIQNRIKKTYHKTETSSTTQTTSGQKDAFEKFLDGELDLATSFWGFLVVGTFIVGFVSGFLSEMIGSWVIIALGIYTWVAVAGTWASAEKYKIIKTKQNQSLVWGFLAQIMCVLNVISTIGLLFETFS